MPDTMASDHELILLIRQEIIQMHGQLSQALQQLDRGNSRFEAIALVEQELKIGMAAIRQDFSRAMLMAEEAKHRADVVQDELQIWQARLKTIALIGGPVIAIAIALVSELLRQWLLP
jgi:FtsZ-binding cell division protein ZapB